MGFFLVRFNIQEVNFLIFYKLGINVTRVLLFFIFGNKSTLVLLLVHHRTPLNKSIMNIRVIQWNISFKCKVDKIAKFLKDHIYQSTIIHLQEVSSQQHDKLIKFLKPDDCAFSLNIRPKGIFEGKNRALGVATFIFNGRIESSHLLDRSVFPERTLLVNSILGTKQVKTLNFHSLTGVDYKKAKSSNFASIADFLHQEKDNIDFFCCDANEPKIDSLHEPDLEFWDNKDKGKNAELLFGQNKVHGLVDSFRTHLINNGITNTSNPLAISHKTGPNGRRYDFIYNSKKWNITSVEYLYQDSIKATSDHSIVIGNYKY